MDGGDVDTRILESFLLDLSNDGCCLGHIVRSANLQEKKLGRKNEFYG